MFEFYKANNHLYANVVYNELVLVSDDLDAAAQTFMENVEDSSGELNDGINREQETVRGENDAFRVVNEDNEINVIERRLGLSDAFVPSMVQEHPVTPESGVCRERRFEVRGSNKISTDVSGDLFARMFPRVFPFGRGHPGEVRAVPVSVHECVKYYTMLSERQFAEAELFSLVAFDRISLSHFRCQRFPSLLDGYESLTGKQLGRAILDNERRRQGCLPWRKRNDDVAGRVLKTVEIGSKSCWGCNAERSHCRHKAIAYQVRLGQSARFVTLTPNTDNSLVLAHYAGISSVSTLFDVVESRVVGKTELREASLKNDCASTRLFMRQVDAFIKYALGIDPATRKKLQFRGRFGDVKAYFGIVETQGRGTLHIHILIWLNNCPPSSTAIDRLLQSPDGDDFWERVISYTRSIVSTDLPIPVEASRCSRCSAPFSKLVGLPIFDSARQDPIPSKKRTQNRVKPTEPALVQCSVCSHRFSSQYLLRSALLNSRPEQWPVWERLLTANELKQQVSREAICKKLKKTMNQYPTLLFTTIDSVCNFTHTNNVNSADVRIRARLLWTITDNVPVVDKYGHTTLVHFLRLYLSEEHAPEQLEDQIRDYQEYQHNDAMQPNLITTSLYEIDINDSCLPPQGAVIMFTPTKLRVYKNCVQIDTKIQNISVVAMPTLS